MKAKLVKTHTMRTYGKPVLALVKPGKVGEKAIVQYHERSEAGRQWLLAYAAKRHIELV